MSFITTVVGGVDDLRLRMLLLLPLSSSFEFEATSFLSLWPLFLVDDDDDDDNDDDDDDASPTALNGRFLFAALNISDVPISNNSVAPPSPSRLYHKTVNVVIAAREWS
jgi:hypothetical protein